MGNIKILPDTLISQIAAGEVVERPASAVKELLENSLDAGATHIAVEAEQGGMKLIAIRDNGCGMGREDARMAFARHATSKITALEDLENIRSFGFRGEALAAIASVSHTLLRTRAEDASEGCEISVKAGKFESVSAAGCPPGTEILVRNLFFNTPARRKFLKTETTELGHIVSCVSHLALANPAVGFELRHNGKILLQVPANSTEAVRAAAVLGKNFLEDALPVSFKTESIHIYGFIGRPGAAMTSKRNQYLFVNGRDVSDPLVSRAVTDAYGGRLPARVWPAFVLHIDISPHEVDVNVHPRKLTVKFLESNRIFRDVKQAVEAGLKEFEISDVIARSAATKQSSFGSMEAESRLPRHDATVQNPLQFSRDFGGLDLPEQETGQKEKLSASLLLGQIANSYLLVYGEEGLTVIDQHAAHERIMYEKFRAASAVSGLQSQKLLVPVSVACSKEEAVFLKDALPHLTNMGFEFDEWSGDTFVIQSCPAALKKENLEKVFREFLGEVMGDRAGEKILPERILKSLACKAAVKFGMPLSHAEQEELLGELSKTQNSATCPHGRPTKVLLSFTELSKRFYR